MNRTDDLEEFAAWLADLTRTGVEPAVLLADAERPFKTLLKSDFIATLGSESRRELRRRQLIYRIDDVTMFVMRSPSGSVSDIHDHGSWGLVGQIAGEERELTYRRLGSDSDEVRLERVASQALRPGDVATILPPKRDIHQVITVSTDPSVTLHVFGHDLLHRGFTVYEPASYSSLVISGHWDNESPSDAST